MLGAEYRALVAIKSMISMRFFFNFEWRRYSPPIVGGGGEKGRPGRLAVAREVFWGKMGYQEDFRSREGLKRPGQLPGHSLHRRQRRPRAAPRNSNKISRLPAARSAAATSPAARSARAPWEAPGPWRRWTSPHRRDDRPRSHQALAAPERPFHHPFASCATRTLPPCNSIGGGW